MCPKSLLVYKTEQTVIFRIIDYPYLGIFLSLLCTGKWLLWLTSLCVDIFYNSREFAIMKMVSHSCWPVTAV